MIRDTVQLSIPTEEVTMSDSRRAHLTPRKSAERAPKTRLSDNPLKTHKQRRPNERARLRKEYR